MRRIGCHVSIAGGVQNAPGRAAALGCEVFQMFSRSPQGGPAAKLTPEIIEAFKRQMAEHSQQACYIHTPYYINFASADEKTRGNSVRIVREELERASLLGAAAIMTHLGSAGAGGDEKEALLRACRSVKEILKGYKGSAELLLEISAGAGAVIGDQFQEVAEIMAASGATGVCFDSAHAFASGYDLRTAAAMAETLHAVQKTIGKKSIRLIHANDSKVGLGERKDRHDHIGDGKIGRAGFVELMRIFDVDFILETEHDKVIEDIAVLKTIRKSVS
ncbi:MAG TPA: deoxyribonuclease IV [Candidatus Paceibacterota bacterium]|nr:deoxyribonuclease IV [Candidatus Paceibacterota bacterium]